VLKIRTCSLLLAILAVAGCSHVAPRYGISATNVESIRASATSPQQKISIGQLSTFKPGLNSISCRAAGPVKPPDGLTYEKYIQGALVSEFKLAGIFDDDSPIVLQGRLDSINFNSNIGAGKWQIDMTFSAQAVAPFQVSTVSRFSTNFAADVACNQVATALPAAVQDLIGHVVAHPSFKSLLNSSRQ
jgi:hypothetical protein